MLFEEPVSIMSLPPSGTCEPLYAEMMTAALIQRRHSFAIALGEMVSTHTDVLARLASNMVRTLRAGKKLLVAGNGGSASEAQHFTAELVGRFKRERNPYAAIALTTDSATLTAIANDYGFGDIFARQLLALGTPGDMFIAFSTSGNSENVVRAAQAARSREMATIAITGNRESRLSAVVDDTLRVPSTDTAVIQELHMIVTHLLCDIIESQLASSEGAEG